MSNDDADSGNTVKVVENGPLLASGQLVIDGVSAESSPERSDNTALCRCGLSKNKPYCDGSHRHSDFRDRGALLDIGTDLEETGGELAIEVRKDGPLRITGNLSICASSGDAVWQGTAAALCRCGLSANKPFCDGTHRREGWSDEHDG